MSLIRIESPHFVAGLVVTGSIVTATAPILKFMLGWRPEQVYRYAAGKGWEAQHADEVEGAERRHARSC